MTAHCLVIVEHKVIVVFLAVTRLPHPVLYFFVGPGMNLTFSCTIILFVFVQSLF